MACRAYSYSVSFYSLTRRLSHWTRRRPLPPRTAHVCVGRIPRLVVWQVRQLCVATQTRELRGKPNALLPRVRLAIPRFQDVHSVCVQVVAPRARGDAGRCPPALVNG